MLFVRRSLSLLTALLTGALLFAGCSGGLPPEGTLRVRTQILSGLAQGFAGSKHVARVQYNGPHRTLGYEYVLLEGNEVVEVKRTGHTTAPGPRVDDDMLVLDFQDVPKEKGGDVRNVAFLRWASVRSEEWGRSTTQLDAMFPEDSGARMMSVRSGETTESSLVVYSITFANSTRRIELRVWTAP